MTYTFPAAQVDPELNAGNTAPAFVLHQVDVAYKFTPLIPGTAIQHSPADLPHLQCERSLRTTPPVGHAGDELSRE